LWQKDPFLVERGSLFVENKVMVLTLITFLKFGGNNFFLNI